MGDMISRDDDQSVPRWVLPEALQYLVDEGDYEGVSGVLTSFKIDTTARLNLLAGAVASGDVTQIRVQAHSIGGSAQLVGADAMVPVCHRMEAEAASGAAELGKLLELIRTRFEETCRAIRFVGMMSES
jgi:HPt (histidine-containing phosphotransfer) domain-containing protein